MCEWLAYSSNNTSLPENWVRYFASRSSHIRDGWGVGWHEGDVAQIVKSEEQIGASEEFPKHAMKAKGNQVMLHARRATSNPGNPLDSHPFSYSFLGGEWLFAHHGFVRPLLEEKYPSLFESKIDSARLFSFIIRKANEYLAGKSIGGIYPAIRHALKQAINKYPESSMNLVLSDGNVLIAFHHHRSKALRLWKQNGNQPAVAVTTIKNFELGGEWTKIESNRLVVVGNGKILVYSDRID